MKEKNFHAEAQGGGGRGDLWFGEVPQTWSVKRLASYFSERKDKVSDRDYPPLSVTKNGVLPQLDNVAKSMDGDNRKLVKKGDFVINSRSDRKGSSGVSLQDGSVSLINIVLQSRRSLCGEYCNYLLKSKSFVEENYRNGRGIVADLWTTRYDEMKMIKIPLPPLPEQEAIVRYLDAETAKIDKAIAAEEKMIALLQERREIIINDAVGGGDFSHAEGRRGGGWEVRRLKSLLMRPLQYGANEAAEDNDYSQPRYIRITDIDDNGKLREETFRSMSMEKAKPYLLEKGDLLFARSGATAGKSFLFQEDYPACFAGYLIRVSLAASIAPKYLFYFTQSGKYRQWKEAVFIQATIQNISAEKYGNLPIPLPPLPEQERIVKYLDAETGKIDRAIEVKRRQIALLRERREIVINEVVTGKVKVA